MIFYLDLFVIVVVVCFFVVVFLIVLFSVRENRCVLHLLAILGGCRTGSVDSTTISEVGES